jgi:magnesium transporter
MDQEISNVTFVDLPSGELDELLNAQLERAIHAESVDAHLHEVAEIASKYSTIDLAHVAARLPTEARSVIFDHLPNIEAKIEFLIATDGATRSTVFRNLEDGYVKKLIEEMPTHEALWVLDNLPERRLRRILEALPQEHANTIRELQQHERRSAGRIMTNEFFAFPLDMTVGEVAAEIRRVPRTELTRRIFVVSHNGQVRGHVATRKLVTSGPQTKLREVMEPVHHTVNPETSREAVVEVVQRYKISTLPVVDADQVLVGVITYEDVVEAMEDITDETLGQVAGTLEDAHTSGGILKRFLSRAPWLIVTLCAGLFNAANMSYFESSVAPWLAFAVFFVPLVMGMSGNVGVQCSTVLVRGMAMGIFVPGGRRRIVGREIVVGMLTGLVFGALCGTVVFGLNAFGIHYLGTNPVAVATIVATGLLAACCTATLLGVFSPLFFAKMGVDPAVSSGPIVTACNDVLSMLIYFLVADGVSSCLMGQA